MKKSCIVNMGRSQSALKYDVSTYDLHRPLNIAARLIRSLAVRIRPAYIRYFYKKDWLEALAAFDTLIVFDGMDTTGVCQAIYRAYPNKRLVLFYWNPLKTNILDEIPSAFEKWTFDYGDAQQYGMRYGGQFCFEKELPMASAEPEYDVYFVGMNKGRFPYLLRLRQDLERRFALRVRYRLVSPFRSLVSRGYSRPISYRQVLEETAKSHFVLEYNQKGQRGLTLRAIEAICLQKKLISNNEALRKMDFFRQSNIYLLDDHLDGLQHFIDTPFEPYPDEVVSRYSFGSWLKRIEEGIELQDTLR